MKKSITVNGYEFMVESMVDDENCYRLMYRDTVVLDDTACGDYYGDIEQVADIMAEAIREECDKVLPWFTLKGALVEWGSDPEYIEDDWSARHWGEIINAGNPWVITEVDEIEEVKPMLDLDGYKVAKVYAFVNGSRGNVCLVDDYE